ncbi:MAG: isoleucine--tRNA ligase [Bacillota bacterium]
MDYSKSLNLPKTTFPMKANLPEREPEILARWDREGAYEQSVKSREGRPKFVLHDGPPYANGDIHIGTALNKVLKDIVVRFATMDGYYAPYVPGWDTHGLPIEVQALKATGVDRSRVSALELRRLCREFALKYKDVQLEQFKRLGVRGDWKNPYLTLRPEYEARQLLVFGQMVDKGYIYKGLKPVYWCADCETALAEAEVEYREKRSPSIYVAFDVTDSGGRLPEGARVVIWTTTPWTIPANLAIALHPQLRYALVDSKKGKLLVAQDLLDEAFSAMGLERGATLATYLGEELEGVVTRHPLYDRESVIILGEHVDTEQGTGCVHTAPGHGEEDFYVGKKYGLDVLVPIDSKGYFTKESGPFEGIFYAEGNKAVTEYLDKTGSLLSLGFINHQYPCCWRCKNPVLFRATVQWFASVEGFRQEALRAVDQVEWIPRWGKDRIWNMVAERSDWCISRQRVWGVPIPIFYCGHGHTIANMEVIAHVASIFRKEGSDAWFAREATELLPEGYRCPECGDTHFVKETDTMDVWFDSGTSHAAVLEERDELTWPADLYLEGSDQHRGWFQSSLLTAVATKGLPPYKAVLTHGFVVDGEGRKMSKSLGNVISPQKVIQQYGADVLRLWVASADYRADIRVSNEILKQLVEVYRKIRNTLRFLLGNLYDFEPEKHSVPYRDLPELDRWALARLAKLLEKVTSAYRRYEYHSLYHSIHNFCVLDMSNTYLDIIKDRLYCSASDDAARRSAQTVLYIIARCLVKMIAPVLVFTAEEVWGYLPRDPGEPASVHLASWPELPRDWADEALLLRFEPLMELRDEVRRALEAARERKEIGGSLDAEVILRPTSPWMEKIVRDHRDNLAAVFIVSAVRVEPGDGPEVEVRRSPGAKCERCWTYVYDLSSDEYPGTCPRCRDVLAKMAFAVKSEEEEQEVK